MGASNDSGILKGWRMSPGACSIPAAAIDQFAQGIAVFDRVDLPGEADPQLRSSQSRSAALRRVCQP
jgi:hypothetical protein